MIKIPVFPPQKRGLRAYFSFKDIQLPQKNPSNSQRMGRLCMWVKWRSLAALRDDKVADWSRARKEGEKKGRLRRPFFSPSFRATSSSLYTVIPKRSEGPFYQIQSHLTTENQKIKVHLVIHQLRTQRAIHEISSSHIDCFFFYFSFRNFLQNSRSRASSDGRKAV